MSRYKITKPTQEELLDVYVKEGATISSLARQYKTSNPTVRSWLIEYDIPRKSHKQASTEANNRHRKNIRPTKKEFELLYNENSIESLEKYYNVGQATIYEWIEELGVILRTPSESLLMCKQIQFKDKYYSKEFLMEQYDASKPFSDLADTLNISRSFLSKLFHIHGLERTKQSPLYRSKQEINLYDYLVSEFPDDKWSYGNREIITPLELDIVNHDKKLAIEYCGLYWHAEFSSGRGKTYHRAKYLLAKEKGYRLITVFESDDLDKVKVLLRKLLGKTNRIYARKTKIEKIDSKTAIEFHNTHHLHNAIGGTDHYGLYDEHNLVMVISFGKTRFSKKYEYECTRMTSHSNVTVVGGASKLFKYFISDINPKSLITYSDLRFGEGKVYLNCGLTEEEQTAPNYWYFKRNTSILHSRVKFQKHKLNSVLETFDSEKTEFENMIDNRWDRIWDCGNAKYTWNNTDYTPNTNVESFMI